MLAGAVVDSGGAGTIAVIEAERRVGERWKLEIEARLLGGVDADDRILGGVVRDSVITVRLARFL